MADRIATARELGEAFGMTDRRVRQLAQDGMFENVGKDNAARFDWIKATNKYVSSLKDQIEELTADQTNVDKMKARADAEYKAAKADQAKLELAEMENNLHRTEDVQEMMEQLLYATRSMIMALPGRVSIDGFNASSPAELADVVRNEAYKILDALSQYEFDPEFFTERVRDRKGWRAIVDDLSEQADKEPERTRKKGRKGVQGT